MSRKECLYLCMAIHVQFFKNMFRRNGWAIRGYAIYTCNSGVPLKYFYLRLPPVTMLTQSADGRSKTPFTYPAQS